MAGTNWFAAARPAEGGSGRRRAARFPCALGTSGLIREEPDGEPDWVAVRNLSAGGVSLVVRNRVEPGVNLTLDLFNKNRHFDCQVPLRVIHVRDYPGDSFLVGGAFARPLNDEELRALI